jgi:hypothetical protein
MTLSAAFVDAGFPHAVAASVIATTQSVLIVRLP